MMILYFYIGTLGASLHRPEFGPGANLSTGSIYYDVMQLHSEFEQHRHIFILLAVLYRIRILAAQ
jgi:hypothetical protein